METIFQDTEAQQIDLFEILKNSGKITVAKKEYSDKLPEYIKKFTGNKSYEELSDFISQFSEKKELVLKRKLRWQANKEYLKFMKGTECDKYLLVHDICSYQFNYLNVSLKGRGTFTAMLFFITEAGVVYESEVELDSERQYGCQGNDWYKAGDIKVSAWRKAKLHIRANQNILNGSETEEILERVNKYGAEWVKIKDAFEPFDILVAPQLEQLNKAGYVFATDKLSCSLEGLNEDSTLQAFNRLTQPGKNMKEIFKTSKMVYTTLKDERELTTWDLFRKMDKQGKLTKDSIEQVYNNRYSEKELKQLSDILGRKYKGKQVFSFDQLQRYLDRLDMYEALSKREALMLISDYLLACEQLDIRPRTDSDSLKREHDVTARILRQKRDEVRAEKMVGVCEKNRMYDYNEHVFFGRAIRGYDDLIDEATQQANCVASYADRIIKNQSLIFVVRSASEPDKSLATVELNPNCTQIRQKYLAHNMPIRNKALTDFIERFRKNCREVYLAEKENAKAA